MLPFDFPKHVPLPLKPAGTQKFFPLAMIEHGAEKNPREPPKPVPFVAYCHGLGALSSLFCCSRGSSQLNSTLLSSALAVARELRRFQCDANPQLGWSENSLGTAVQYSVRCVTTIECSK